MTRGKLRGDYSEIVGESPQIVEVLQRIENFAATPMKILISGETGTGKELVARALHKNSGRSGEIVSVNCAALPKSLLESELFGHEKGAFTSADARRIGKFERAHKGTLFLDEISEMPLSMQPKLLRAIEENRIERLGGETLIPVDVRIITATNRDLAQDVRDRMFRKDLYYRLSGAAISVPTLAERQEDVEALVAHFLRKHCPSDELEELPKIAPSTLALLKSYPWPGNVRELENAVQRAFYAAKPGDILPEHLPEEIQIVSQDPANVSKTLPTLENKLVINVPIGTTLAAMEEKFVCATVAWVDGNRTKAAKILGIHRRTLQRKLEKYDIT